MAIGITRARCKQLLGMDNIVFTDKETVEKLQSVIVQEHQRREDEREKHLIDVERRRVRKLINEGQTTWDPTYDFVPKNVTLDEKSHAKPEHNWRGYGLEFPPEFVPNPTRTPRQIHEYERDSCGDPEENDVDTSGQPTDVDTSAQPTDAAEPSQTTEGETQEGAAEEISNQKDDAEHSSEDAQRTSEATPKHAESPGSRFQRQKTEVTLAFEREETVQGMYELASKMVLASTLTTK